MSESVTPPEGCAPRCSTEGCERGDLIKSAGLCRRCYQLMRIGRDPAKPLRNRRHGATCSREGCEEKYRCSGLCERHYRQSRGRVPRSGGAAERKRSPVREKLTAAAQAAIFWSKVDKRGPDECWPWTRTPTSGGYGQLRWLGRASSAHRVAYELAIGPVPAFVGERTHIDHTCHDPNTCKLKTKCPHRRCCNPAHLEAVSHSENLRRGDTSRPGNGGSAPCPPGCICKRHQGHSHAGGVKCQPGCTCKRHNPRPRAA